MAPSSSSASPRQRSTNQRVVLNVGGRCFETTVSTLTASSTYFASQFSHNWNQECSSENDPIFVDQDPKIFEVLLQFMRRGFIPEEQLTVDLLCQAEYFGVDCLVNEVKNNAYRSCHHGFVGTEQQAIHGFGKEFASLTEAASQGLFSTRLRLVTRQTTKEYATLYLHFDSSRCDGKIIPCFAGLCSKLFEYLERDSSTTDAGGFMNPVFALNFLGKFGFHLAPPHLQNYTSASPHFSHQEAARRSLGYRGQLLGEWVFVRDKPNEVESKSVVIPSTASTLRSEPQEYALVLWSSEFGTFITASGGDPLVVGRLGGAALRNVGIIRLHNMAEALQWLEDKGFTEIEEELQELFKLVTAIKITKLKHSYLERDWGRVQIFSRPLREQDPLIENIIPLPFRDDGPDSVFPTFQTLLQLTVVNANEIHG